MQKGLWVAQKRRNKIKKSVRKKAQHVETSLPVLAGTAHHAAVDLTIAILMGRPCTFTWIHYTFNRIKNDKSPACRDP